MNKEAGRPTLLDDHLFRKIKDLVLDGLKLRQIAESLDISYATMRDWEYENYKGFSDRMLSFKHERMIQKAETNVEVLQSSEDERVNLQANTFVLETIGKKNYSKKIENELSNPDGNLKTIIIQKYASDNQTTTKTDGTLGSLGE